MASFRKKLKELRLDTIARWRKLLKAEAKHNLNKVKKHETKLIKLELKTRQLKDKK